MASDVRTLFTDKTGTGAGDDFRPKSAKRTFQLKGSTSSGAGAIDCDIEVSNDRTNWERVATISLVLGTTETSDSFVHEAPYLWTRGKVTAISGTGAKGTLILVDGG